MPDFADPSTARSKVWVCDHSLAGIAGATDILPGARMSVSLSVGCWQV